MGIVNVTPDSFSDGGRFLDPTRRRRSRAEARRRRGRHPRRRRRITRPGAEPVPLDEELRRVLPVVAELAKRVRARSPWTR